MENVTNFTFLGPQPKKSGDETVQQKVAVLLLHKTKFLLFFSTQKPITRFFAQTINRSIINMKLESGFKKVLLANKEVLLSAK